MMLFRCAVTILALSCSAAVLGDVDEYVFLIRSSQYGYIHHYGVYNNQDLLQFTKNPSLAPAKFQFLSNGALQEISTDKCVKIYTPGNRLLILISNCDDADIDRWLYNNTTLLLYDLTVPYPYGCFSPWDYRSVPPFNLDYTAGVSPCDTWNQIFLDVVPGQEA